MFAHAHQGGSHVPVFSPVGREPLKDWQASNLVKKVYNRGVKGYVYHVQGGAASRMTLPKRSSRGLGLRQQFICFQLMLLPSRPFMLELNVLDTEGTRRRLVFSTAFTALQATPLHAQVPLACLDAVRGRWTNVCFDLCDLTTNLFRAKDFRSVELISVGAACKLRHIFTMRDQPLLTRHLEEEAGQSAGEGVTRVNIGFGGEIPAAHQFPGGLEVPVETVLLNTAVAHVHAEARREEKRERARGVRSPGRNPQPGAGRSPQPGAGRSPQPGAGRSPQPGTGQSPRAPASSPLRAGTGPRPAPRRAPEGSGGTHQDHGGLGVTPRSPARADSSPAGPAAAVAFGRRVTPTQKRETGRSARAQLVLRSPPRAAVPEKDSLSMLELEARNSAERSPHGAAPPCGALLEGEDYQRALEMLLAPSLRRSGDGLPWSGERLDPSGKGLGRSGESLGQSGEGLGRSGRSFSGDDSRWAPPRSGATGGSASSSPWARESGAEASFGHSIAAAGEDAIVEYEFDEEASADGAARSDVAADAAQGSPGGGAGAPDRAATWAGGLAGAWSPAGSEEEPRRPLERPAEASDYSAEAYGAALGGGADGEPQAPSVGDGGAEGDDGGGGESEDGGGEDGDGGELSAEEARALLSEGGARQSASNILGTRTEDEEYFSRLRQDVHSIMWKALSPTANGVADDSDDGVLLSVHSLDLGRAAGGAVDALPPPPSAALGATAGSLPGAVDAAPAAADADDEGAARPSATGAADGSEHGAPSLFMREEEARWELAAMEASFEHEFGAMRASAMEESLAGAAAAPRWGDGQATREDAGAADDEEVELIYDPETKLYFDPQSGRYFELMEEGE